MTNSAEKRIWGIHTNNDSLFIDSDVIAIGWSELGNIGLFDNNRDTFKKKYLETYPGDKKGLFGASCG